MVGIKDTKLILADTVRRKWKYRDFLRVFLYIAYSWIALYLNPHADFKKNRTL
jgi:hypothetical protein